MTLKVIKYDLSSIQALLFFLLSIELKTLQTFKRINLQTYFALFFSSQVVIVQTFNT